MAFFGLSDINFNPDTKRTFGPLSALENTPYKQTSLKYPTDVGSYDKGHYMVFFVREQKETRFSASGRGGGTFDAGTEKAIQEQLATGISVSNKTSTSKLRNVFAQEINGALTNAISQGTNFLSQKGGKLGSKIGGTINNFVAGPKQSSSEQKYDQAVEYSIKSISDKSPFGFLNTTQLTTDAIALYMPDTINFDSKASYDGLNPGKELLGQALVAAPAIVDEYRKGGGAAALNALKKSGALQNVGQKVLDKFNLGGDTARLGVFGFTGKVTNPMIELIYSAPDFRSFQFEFFFYPRSEAEALEVQKIIDRFRFHQAPELDVIGEAGRQSGLLIPPSEFDIKFFYAGKQNPNIPAIATCVLESIQVNYAPNGWSAYEVPGENDPLLGRTGMPVGIQMSLQFKETTYVTKSDFGDQKIGGATMSGMSASYASGQKNVFS
jgi:hypothetical protein